MADTPTNQVPQLPNLDTEPDVWGPEHDELSITDEEIRLGNLEGALIDPDEDEDNGR